MYMIELHLDEDGEINKIKAKFWEKKPLSMEDEALCMSFPIMIGLTWQNKSKDT